ncbi:C-type lectin domain family 4 member E-like isoform X4 [Poecilia latipinna]|uniref:C-type lectin domain family 4 member E-like isoform X4 n=1 Tax=Poecilia latipinna TaxID=48699 RepID=UPI00072ECCD4|nr:PREDICTED: C-type lectin domain family 4 member E-like isoform X4 [Poecilia latipinna]
MRFTKSAPRDNATLVDDNIYDDVMVSKQQDVSSVADEIYDDVMVSKQQDNVSSFANNSCTEDQLSKQKDLQQPGLDRKSKISPEHAVLLVLMALLVIAVFALSITVFYLMKNERCQTLKEDLESLKMIALDETCPKCEAGWERHRGSSYFFSNSTSSWTDSRHSCTDLGSDLVKIDSREEQVFLIGRVRDLMKDNQDKFWIGLTDSKEEGKWLWMDGSALDQSLSFWNQTQPDNKSPAHSAEAEADCVRMGKKEKKGGSDDLKSWFDTSCKRPQKSICEKTAKLSSSV